MIIILGIFIFLFVLTGIIVTMYQKFLELQILRNLGKMDKNSLSKIISNFKGIK